MSGARHLHQWKQNRGHMSKTIVGDIDEKDDIEWGCIEPLKSDGINPAISVNSQGDVESHQTKTLRRLCHTSGHIRRNKSITWEDTSMNTTGEYPAIALDDSGFVLEVHKTNIGNKLLQSQGLLNQQEQGYPS